MLWGQATLAEIHALNACFAAAVCFLALPWAPSPSALSPARRIALGLVWGLSLGNSLTIVALAPIALPALWNGARGRWAGLAAFGVGVCVYALIPVRASTQPAINWGDARSLSNFIWLVSGQLYHGYLLSAPLDLAVQRVLGLPRLWLEQMGWVGALWAVWGVATYFNLRRLIPAGLSVALYVAFAVTYNTQDSILYLIPVWILSAGYLGIGLTGLLASQRDRFWRQAIGAIAGLGVVAMLAGGWRTHDLSADRAGPEFAERVLASLPRHAILITPADAYTFALWYHEQVVGRRPDVSVVDARLIGYAWYEPMLIAQGAAPNLPLDRSETGLGGRLAALNPSRSVCELALEPERTVCRPPLARDD
jgi:hypothetical protein